MIISSAKCKKKMFYFGAEELKKEYIVQVKWDQNHALDSEVPGRYTLNQWEKRSSKALPANIISHHHMLPTRGRGI